MSACSSGTLEGGIGSSLYSPQCEAVLKGGHFDARVFLKRARATGDVAEDAEEQGRFLGKLRIVDILNRHPEHIIATQQRLSDLVQGITASGGKSSKMSGDRFPVSCKRVGKLPAAWLASWLLDHCSSCGSGLTTQRLTALHRSDPDFVSFVFCYLLAVTPDTPLPDECTDTVVASRVFKMRLETIGRHKTAWWDLVNKGIASKGTIQWGMSGCFSVSLMDGGGKGIEHCDGAKVDAPKGLPIPDRIEIIDNHLDQRARFFLEGVSAPMYFHSFFDPSAGPNTVVVTGGKGGGPLKTLAKDVERHVKQERLQTSGGSTKRVREELDLAIAANKRDLASARARAKAKIAPKKKASRVSLITSGGAEDEERGGN